MATRREGRGGMTTYVLSCQPSALGVAARIGARFAFDLACYPINSKFAFSCGPEESSDVFLIWGDAHTVHVRQSGVFETVTGLAP